MRTANQKHRGIRPEVKGLLRAGTASDGGTRAWMPNEGTRRWVLGTEYSSLAPQLSPSHHGSANPNLSRSGKKIRGIPKKFPDIEHFSRFDAVGRLCRFRPPGGISGAEDACDLINAPIGNNTQGPSNELRLSHVKTLQKAIDHRQIGPVFLSPKGEAWTVGNLSSTHRRLRDAAGLPRDLVLYLARHRFGTEALRAGVPLKDVAELMGHVSVTTTEIYLHRDVTELAGGQDRLPPVWDGESPATAG
jgi:hypothetical protein